METETNKTVILPIESLKAAPFTRKLLGDSHVNLKKLSHQNSTSFEQIEHMEHLNALRIDNDPSKSKSKTTYLKMINSKLDELKQKRTTDCGEFKSVKQVHKTAKFAMIFKLKKEDVKQMQNGDTTILKSFFKNISTESVLKPENFEIMSEQNLQTIIENIRQAASVIQMQGTKKLELPLGVWSTSATKHGPTMRKQHLTNNSRHTQCDYAALDSGFSHKPFRALIKQQNCPVHQNKATQYEALTKRFREESIQKHCLDRSVQCELLKPVLSPRCRLKKETKPAHKCVQSEQLSKKLSETSFLLLKKNILYSKQIDEELLRSLNESQDSLDIARKKFSKKQIAPRNTLQEAGEVQTSDFIDEMEFTKEWCEANEEDNEQDDENTNRKDLIAVENIRNNVKSEQKRPPESPVQFDDNIFAFLDEIYSDLSLSDQDDFRATLKTEVKSLPKGILRKTVGNSKIPKPCLKKGNDLTKALQFALRKSAHNLSSSSTGDTNEAEKNQDSNTKQSKIPILRINKPASQSQLVKQTTALSNHSTKALEVCNSKKTIPMRQIRSAITFNSEQRKSQYEKQRQLIEIIVKGVEQEMKSSN